jgi:Transposase DDE domain
MRRYSPRGAAGGARAPNPLKESAVPTGFLDAWNRLVGGWTLPPLPARRGRKPRVPVTDLLAALTFHVLSGPGTLADHFSELFDEPLADSSWADRRGRLPWEVFADLMGRVLRPRATRPQHREAFWRSWRLVALDGTQFSLINTPQVTATIEKARTRRGRAAFAKITSVVLLELGLHNPLAAAIGREGESEWALAQRLLAQLPKRALLLGDRLYGVVAFALVAQAACRRVGSHFLLRASRSVKPRLISALRDGTRLVGLPVRARNNPNRVIDWLEVREIRVRVGRKGHRAHELRLWTSLVDPAAAPALELARVYASRWEHELYFREVKRQLRKTDVLQSHTVETGAQEIAAVILASALVAIERTRAAAGHMPVLRVSFPKVLDWVRASWLALSQFDDVLTDRQMNTFLRRVYTQMGRCVTAERRSRSYPRAVRQPIRRWPRLLHNESITGPLHFEIL